MYRVVSARQALDHEINGVPTDRFTLGHVAAGVMMGLARFDFWTTVAVAVGFEFLEEALKDRMPWMFPNPTSDSTPNRVMDVVGIVAGWALVRTIWPEHGR